MTKISEYWEAYRDIVLKNTNDVTVEHSRLAFYAGVGSIMKSITSAAENDSDELFHVIDGCYREMSDHFDKTNDTYRSKHTH